MKIIDSIKERLYKAKDKRESKRLSKLEGDIMTILNKHDKAVFNPRLVNGIFDENEELEFSRRVLENRVWYTGKPKLLRRFYTTNPDLLGDTQFFWQRALPEYRKVHSGIPNLISTKMGTILFGSGYATNFEIYKKDNEGKVTNELDEDAAEKAQNTWQAIEKKIQFKRKLREMAACESVDGHLFAKLSVDPKLSDFPIIEIGNMQNAEVVKERGITKKIIFKTWLNTSAGTKNDAVFYEIYTTTSEGEACIINKLYKLIDGELKEVDLKEHSYTEDLDPTIIFKGLKGLLAFEKPNKLPNAEFPDSPYGASDYSGALSSFDGLDETLSEIFAEIRNNKTIRYIPKNMMETYLDTNGNVKIREFNNFITNYQKIDTASVENAKNEISITQIPDKMESLLSKWKVAITTAINNAGLSPLALGITGLEAVNAGEQSQRERNKTTLETRSDKLDLWQPFLEDMIIKILEFNNWIVNVYNFDQQGIDKIDLDWTNTNVGITFGDYIIESKKEKIDTWGNALTVGVASTETAIDMIYDDWSEEAKAEEVARIKFEKGMSMDDPNNLPGLEEEALNKEKRPQDDNDKELDENGNPIDREDPNKKSVINE
jgi:A118 family predicted phage portal protein